MAVIEPRVKGERLNAAIRHILCNKIDAFAASKKYGG